jgi:hypothetical protein
LDRLESPKSRKERSFSSSRDHGRVDSQRERRGGRILVMDAASELLRSGGGSIQIGGAGGSEMAFA